MVAKTSSDPRLILRFGDYADVGIVTKFIDEHWKLGHILARDRELFEYMYLQKDGRLNFVIAIDPLSDEVIAILGYIPSNELHSRISLSMWMSHPDEKLRNRKTGLSVLRFLINEIKPNSIFSAGINEDTKIVYEFLGYSCGLMDHFVLANKELDEYRILKNPPKSSFFQPFSDRAACSFRTVESEVDLCKILSDLDFDMKLKDSTYLCHRYLRHPRFAYEIREVLVNGETVGVVVFRRLFAMGRSCIRIIDVIGGEKCLETAIYPLIREMLMKRDEYIDLLCWGLDRDQVKEIGFFDRRESDECVVPDFFSPFIQLNIDRWLFTNLPHTEKIFKGDGDQDRPN
jgi:hypothetical protein